MADEEQVNAGEQVKWEPVRNLAQKISKLYADKKIFELGDLDNPSFIVSTKSARSTDPNARVCTTNSAIQGCVYLAKDVTAPFRVDKLGKEVEIEEKVLAFEFAYHPDKYEEYLNGSAQPVLTTQYLLYRDTVDNAESRIYTSDCIAEELSDAGAGATFNDRLTIANLIESDRSKIRQFWSNNEEEDEEEDEEELDPEIAGELYMLFNAPSGDSDCCYIARVAFAGLNSNGNGNSEGDGGTPAPWVSGNIGTGIDRFVQESPWMGSNYAVTLTGVTMDRQNVSDAKAAANNTDGFKPETPGAGSYAPPPIGCSSQFIWPTLGAEGGGGVNSFYSPGGVFGQYVDWADWREAYRQPLTATEVNYAKAITHSNSPDDAHFPCYLGEGRTGDLPSSYDHISTSASTATPYQRWVEVPGTNGTVFVRMVPMEFNVPGDSARKAYLAVPATIAKVLRPKSYQTAIRKRWYDMLYYSLRNIAGYKYTKITNGIASHRVIGVTWDRGAVDDLAMMNPCMEEEDTSQECSCVKCSYERWKHLGLGGEDSKTDETATPFIGTEAEFILYSEYNRNAAQMWTWDPERLTEISKHTEDALKYDTLFPELYFERLLCYNNKQLYSKQFGGFELEEKDDELCECLVCHNPEYKNSPYPFIQLPWDGGGDNSTCEDNGISSYTTHAYTFNVLTKIAKFITDYKLPENEPRDESKLEIGYCYCPAIGGDELGINLGDEKKVNHLICKEESMWKCITETTKLTIPAVPKYYRTKSEKEKAALYSTGAKCEVHVPNEVKPFGYNAYIWKAVDIGGYIDSENRKDIKIEFIHYKPARVCGSRIIAPKDMLEDTETTYYDYYALDLYDPHYYKFKPSSSNLGSPPSIQFSAEGDTEAFKHNSTSDAHWKESLYWCFNGNDDWPTCSAEINPPAGKLNRACMCHRDNEFTSIGTLEVYVAPFYDAEGGNLPAKLLGSCRLQRTTEQHELENAEYLLPYSCYSTNMYDNAMWCEDSRSYKQPVKTDEANTFTARNAENLVVFSVDHQPDDINNNSEENYVKVDITIPKDLLLEEVPEEGGVDVRQKYIIVAIRASHTHLNSVLFSGKSVDSADADTKKWATFYAGACRYAEFKTSYKFSKATEE